MLLSFVTHNLQLMFTRRDVMIIRMDSLHCRDWTLHHSVRNRNIFVSLLPWTLMLWLLLCHVINNDTDTHVLDNSLPVSCTRWCWWLTASMPVSYFWHNQQHYIPIYTVKHKITKKKTAKYVFISLLAWCQFMCHETAKLLQLAYDERQMIQYLSSKYIITLTYFGIMTGKYWDAAFWRIRNSKLYQL